MQWEPQVQQGILMQPKQEEPEPLEPTLLPGQGAPVVPAAAVEAVAIHHIAFPDWPDCFPIPPASWFSLSFFSYPEWLPLLFHCFP